MNNELITNVNSQLRTKLNKALEPDENGMVSARRLYEMLGLDKSHFARWCERNFINTDLVVENVDYITIRPMGETPTGGKIELVDYMLKLRIAERLCLSSKSPAKDEIMDYFLDLEDSAPKAAMAIQEQNEMMVQFSDMLNQLKIAQEKIDHTLIELKETTEARLDILEEKGEVVLDAPTEWAADMMKHVRKIADFYTRGDTNKCMDRLIERAEDYMCETYETLKADFAAHSNGKKAKKILIMARDEDTRDAFERAVKDYEIEFGLYEQNAGQKFLEEFTKDMFEEAYVREYTPIWNPSDEELAAQYADMEKMYGPGWDKGDDYGSKDSDE